MSPPGIDEPWIEREEPPGAELGGDAEEFGLRQYTLRELFAFLTAIAVALSLAVSGTRVIVRLPDVGLLLLGLGAIVAWVVLAVAYRRLHARGAFAVHYATAVFGLVFSFGPVFYAFPPIASMRAVFVFGLFGAVGCGCVVGSAFSVPVFVVTMVCSAVKGSRRASIIRREREEGGPWVRE